MEINTPAGHRPRVGASLDTQGGESYLVDLAGALQRFDGQFGWDADFPRDMIELLRAGPDALQVAAAAQDVARQIFEKASAAEFEAAGLAYKRRAVRVLAPITRPGKVIAIGANYEAHIQEGRNTGALDGNLPPYPPAFLKMSTAVVGTDEPVVFPYFGSELDYEVEFSIVIGTACQNVAEEDWLSVVAGFTIVNDLGLRDVILQEKEDGLVLAGKNFATACPMGPYLVTKDEIPAPQDSACACASMESCGRTTAPAT